MAAQVLRNTASSFFKKRVLCQLTAISEFHLSPRLDKVISFNLSDIGEGIREVTVKEWFVKVGDVVEQFDKLCEVQSDKASVTITSRYDGKITKLYKNIDEIALVGKPLIDFDINAADELDTKSESSSDSDVEEHTINLNLNDSNKVQKLITLTTPAVRRIAKENNVDLSKVPPTGRNGRVLKGDVMEYLGLIPPGTNIPHSTMLEKEQPKLEASAVMQSNLMEPLKGVRKAMFKSMSESLKIPHFAYSDEIDMTKLIEFRDQLRDVAKLHGIPKLTFMPFCIKAASISLIKYPILNSSIDLENECIIYKTAHNISIAIDTPNGLVVPNIKNCQNKDIIEIAKDLNSLAHRGRNGTLTPEDFQDGSFTLSNIGIIGGTYTHPCIMSPQVSIGGIGRTKVVPRYNDNGDIVKAHIMNISWAADHRVIDGVTMANFSNVWKNHLENPALFLLSSIK